MCALTQQRHQEARRQIRLRGLAMYTRRFCSRFQILLLISRRSLQDELPPAARPTESLPGTRPTTGRIESIVTSASGLRSSRWALRTLYLTRLSIADLLLPTDNSPTSKPVSRLALFLGSA